MTDFTGAGVDAIGADQGTDQVLEEQRDDEHGFGGSECDSEGLIGRGR